MNKLLSDTRLVAALIALVIVCLTVLAVVKVIPGDDVAKLLGGFLTGVILTWQRGAVSVEKTTSTTTVEEKKETPVEKKSTSIPPVLPLICLAFLFLPAATCAQAKPIIRTVNDIAADWCVAHYSSVKGFSAEDALKTFCTGEKALKPWLDLILMGQKNGVERVGVSAHEPECEVTVTKESAQDAAVTDAGKD